MFIIFYEVGNKYRERGFIYIGNFYLLFRVNVLYIYLVNEKILFVLVKWKNCLFEK